MRDALGATSQEICDTSHNNYGSRFARFGKHSMLLYIHGIGCIVHKRCMHVSFTRPPALRARQYGSRCCACRP